MIGLFRVDPRYVTSHIDIAKHPRLHHPLVGTRQPSPRANLPFTNNALCGYNGICFGLAADTRRLQWPSHPHPTVQVKEVGIYPVTVISQGLC